MIPAILQLGGLGAVVYGFLLAVVFPILVLALVWDIRDQTLEQTEHLERIEEHLSQIDDHDDERPD